MSVVDLYTNRKLVEFSSTDGDLLVEAESIECVTNDPTHPETSMLMLKSGRTYEVSGDMRAVKKKLGLKC